MKTWRFLYAVIGAFAVASPALAETGFLDRSLTVETQTFRYQVYVPLEFDTGKAWPVIIYLHGNGSQGTDGLLPTRQGLADQVRQQRSEFPAIILFPQTLTSWEESATEELVMAELEKTISEFRGDRARVYLTGHSMGAAGAYRIAYRWPERFAALVAVAGRVDDAPGGNRPRAVREAMQEADRRAHAFLTAERPYFALADRIKAVPTWIFHGDADQVVRVAQSRQLSEALLAVGAPVKYTEYPGVGHVDAQIKAFADSDLVKWLFQQRR